MIKNKELITSLSRNATLWHVVVYSAGVAAYSAIAVYVETQTSYTEFTNLPADVHAALTLVLGWLLVFRTNTSYARWWEARTLWGSLVNTCRSLSIKIVDLVRLPEQDLIATCGLIQGFAFVLRDHLRHGADLDEIPGTEKPQEKPAHVPSWMVSRLYQHFYRWKQQGLIDGDELRVLDDEARRFMDICGGCERIRNTLLAQSYRLFARQCVFLYLITLPWGIVQSFHWWTIPLTAIISYFMLGLETVAEHVEEPFGHDEDDLDLDGLCQVIRTSVHEIFERRRPLDADRPSPPLPK